MITGAITMVGAARIMDQAPPVEAPIMAPTVAITAAVALPPGPITTLTSRTESIAGLHVHQPLAAVPPDRLLVTGAQAPVQEEEDSVNKSA